MPLLEVIGRRGGRGIGHKGDGYCPHPAWTSLMSGDPGTGGKGGDGAICRLLSPLSQHSEKGARLDGLYLSLKRVTQ